MGLGTGDEGEPGRDCVSGIGWGRNRGMTCGGGSFLVGALYVFSSFPCQARAHDPTDADKTSKLAAQKPKWYDTGAMSQTAFQHELKDGYLQCVLKSLILCILRVFCQASWSMLFSYTSKHPAQAGAGAH